MDQIDQDILSALRRDGRATYAELGAGLGLSRATIRSRIERMVASGEIVGFSVITRSDVSPLPVRAQMMIGIEGRGTERITARLLGMTAVLAVHATNGKWDLIAEIGTRTLEELDGVIGSIRRLEGVTISETNLLLSSRRSTRNA